VAHVALPLLALLTSVAQAEPVTVLVLRAGLADEETAVVQALRIYTADLGARVEVAGDAPATLAPDAVGRMADQARSAGATFVAWAHRQDGSRVLYLFAVETRDLRETAVEPVGLASATEALALKVRALLTVSHGGSSTPAAEPTPPVVASPPATPPGAARPGGSPADRPQADVAVTRPPPSARARVGSWSWLGIGASYGLWVPSQTRWLRHGIRLALEARPGATRWSGYLDVALTSRPEETVGGDTVSLRDVPFGLGAVSRWQGRVAGVAIGPRASLHVLDVTGDPPGPASGTTRRFSAGIGGLAAVDVPLVPHLRAFWTVSAELVVPAREFTVQGRPAAETGSFLLATTVGAAAWVP
jgi:hypothetical protein